MSGLKEGIEKPCVYAEMVYNVFHTVSIAAHEVNKSRENRKSGDFHLTVHLF